MDPMPGAAGSERIRLILGLGNPGPEYADTPHNVGFRVVEELCRRRGVALDADECNTRLGRANGVLLGQPMTFMNRSGHAARCLVERRGLDPDEDLLVVLDDVHLPLGRIRLRRGGSAGGHKGLASVLESLQTGGVARLRLGVGPSEEQIDAEAMVDFVLSPFPASQATAVSDMVATAAECCDAWLADGVEAAMNRYNG